MQRTGQGVKNPPRIIVEHVDGAVLMPACREFPIITEIHAHAKAARACAARFVFPNLGSAPICNIPHVDPAIVGGARQVASIVAESNRPYLARLHRWACDLTTVVPLACLLVILPYLDLASEARAGGVEAVARCADVVAA